MQVRFNINDSVLVRYTERGIKILEDKHNEMLAQGIKLQPWKQPKVDSEGYTKVQLWELMYNFGEYIWNGCHLPFETEMIFL